MKVKLVRWMESLRDGQTYARGWKTADGRFTIEPQKLHGQAVWWLVRDMTGRALTRAQDRDYSTLAEARAVLELLLAGEAGEVE